MTRRVVVRAPACEDDRRQSQPGDRHVRSRPFFPHHCPPVHEAVGAARLRCRAETGVERLPVHKPAADRDGHRPGRNPRRSGALFAPTLENEFQVIRESSSGSIVFLERLDRHRLADRWVELPVTGVFEVKAGLISYWRDYFDAATILSQWPTN